MSIAFIFLLCSCSFIETSCSVTWLGRWASRCRGGRGLCVDEMKGKETNRRETNKHTVHI